MNLYEINSRLLELVDPETGELLDLDEFQKLHMYRDEKIEGMVLWYKNLTAQAKAIKEEIDNLTKRQRAAQRRADGLLNYITRMLDGEKFSTPRCSVSYRKSCALKTEDTAAVAFWLNKNGFYDMVVYSEPKIDKRAVTDLIKNGTEVPGAEIEERISTQVR